MVQLVHLPHAGAQDAKGLAIRSLPRGLVHRPRSRRSPSQSSSSSSLGPHRHLGATIGTTFENHSSRVSVTSFSIQRSYM